MRKNFIIVLILLLCNITFSQKNKVEQSFKQFISDYNSASYHLIFESFSGSMQQTLPIENTKDFFSGLQSEAGIIIASELYKSDDNSSVTFKTTFERSIFLVQISVDAKNKISSLLVNPFIEPSTSILINHLDGYPVDIASTIYENVKDFPLNTEIAIAIIKAGKPKYYGVKIVNDTLKSYRNSTKIFEIGSLSKVFTATILSTLVVEGKIELKDNINPNFPFLFNSNAAITFETLANHTSGLPRLPTNLDVSNTENPYKNYGAKEFDYYLAHQLQLNSAKDKLYEYSNTGAGLLGYALGLSQQSTYSELLSELIFKKYKMNSSFTNSKSLGNNLVHGLNATGEKVSNWDFDVLEGAGGILSTTSDLVQFANAQFQLTNEATQLTQKPTAIVNENMKVGLGWHLLKSKKGYDLIWHNGGTGGYSSSMALDVKNKNGVIILSNVSALTPKNKKIDALCFSLTEILY